MEPNLSDWSREEEEMLPFSPKIWSLQQLFPNGKHPTCLHPASEHGSLRTIDDDSDLMKCIIPLNEKEELELAIRAAESNHERWMFDYECSKSDTSMTTSNDGIEVEMMEPQVTQLEDH